MGSWIYDVTCNFRKSDLTPPPNYLSHLIGYVYVFTVSVGMFKLSFIADSRRVRKIAKSDY